LSSAHHESYNKNYSAKGLPGIIKLEHHGYTFYLPLFTTKIDIEVSDTIAGLKTKIHEAQGHPVGVQKIIYAGITHLNYPCYQSSCDI
jgi:hypothetical protein